MKETPLEQDIQEVAFAGLLQTHSEVFFCLSNSLEARRSKAWNPRHYFQLINEANALESFLDDYGARYNREYTFFTEVVASLRGFAQAGYSLSHLIGRLSSYGVDQDFPSDEPEFKNSLERVRDFVRASIVALLKAAKNEASRLGLEITPQEFPEQSFLPVSVRQKLPRNVGVEDLKEEEQKIAEVISKYLLACDMLANVGLHKIESETERRQFLGRVCTEEKARVYEATVHNLQSTYDTYIRNTVLEAKDGKLSRVRGFITISLHLFEAVTHLTHFYERHDSDIRSEQAKKEIATLVSPSEVQDVILNDLLYWSVKCLTGGRVVAEELLASYTNAKQLEVDLEDNLILHARPAALIVGIVNRYGTPVELELAGQKCNAASIIDLLLTVGSHPEEKHFVFRGDALPLNDIALLFQNDLGEGGVEKLPPGLAYLLEK